MKKAWKKHLVVWLAFAMLVIGLPQIAVAVPEGKVADPFAEMVNPEVEPGVSDHRSQEKGYVSQELKNALLEPFSEKLPEAAGEETQEERPPWVLGMTDRYIVKFKNGDEETFAKKTNQLVESSRKVERSVKKNDKATAEELTVLTLAEAMLPEDVAQELKNAGLANSLEYIQPDFLLNFQGLDPVLDPQNAESDPTEDSGEPVATTDVVDPEESMEPTVEPSVEPEETAGFESEESQPAVVALIDSYVDVEHPLLAGSLWINPNETLDGTDTDGNGYIDDIHGWNFVDKTNQLCNEDNSLAASHGTHLAGIIAKDNPGVQIMPLAVFSPMGAYTSDIIAAIEYARSMDVKVINCSFGSTQENQALQETIEATDALFVCAAGNARNDLVGTPVYPACYNLPNVLSVASVNADEGFSFYSNYSASKVDLAARGRDVESALPGGETGMLSGTSQAAAQVSAVAGAVLNENPELAIVELKARLIATADRLNNLQNKVVEGRRVSRENALANTITAGILTVNPDDDFDVFGWDSNPRDGWELFSQSPIKDVQCGANFILVLLQDGTVWAWGKNDYGQLGDKTTVSATTPVQVKGLKNVTAIAAGGTHGLALKANGTVWAWGKNDYGQLGNNSTTTSLIPIQVATKASDIAATGSLSAFVANGYPYTNGGLNMNLTLNFIQYPNFVNGVGSVISIRYMGGNLLMEHSNGTVYHAKPRTNNLTIYDLFLVQGLTSLQGVGKSGANICVTQDGTVAQFDYSTSAMNSIAGVPPVVEVTSVGNILHLALTSDGTLMPWGYMFNTHGNELCAGIDGLGSSVPLGTVGPQLPGATHLSVGQGFVVAWGDNKIWAWGKNVSYIGGWDAMLPTPLGGIDNVKQVVASTETTQLHQLFLKEDGTVWAQGYNDYGQLGLGYASPYDTYVPLTQVPGLADVKAVAAGMSFSVALKENGTVWTWGRGDWGSLGHGSPNRLIPGQVSNLTNVVAIEAYSRTVMVTKADGSVWGWGPNNFGQLGVTTSTCYSPVQASMYTGALSVSLGQGHSLALMPNGTVMACGYNGTGQLGNGSTQSSIQPNGSLVPTQVSGLTNVVATAAGNTHSLALRSNGTVWAWGSNSEGQLGQGNNNFSDQLVPVKVKGLSNNIVSIVATSEGSGAIDANGNVYLWGKIGQAHNSMKAVQCSVRNITQLYLDSNQLWAMGHNGQLWYIGPMSSQTLNSIPQRVAALKTKSDFDNPLSEATLADGQNDVVTVGEMLHAFDSDWYRVENASTLRSRFVFEGDEQIAFRLMDDDWNEISPDLDGRYFLEPEESCYLLVHCAASTKFSNALPYSFTLAIQLPDTPFDEGWNPNGDTHTTTLRGRGFTDFTEKTFVVVYDPAKLELIDLNARTETLDLALGLIGSDMVVLSHDSAIGEITFRMEKNIPSGKTFSGVMGVLKFSLLDTQTPPSVTMTVLQTPLP